MNEFVNIFAGVCWQVFGSLFLKSLLHAREPAMPLVPRVFIHEGSPLGWRPDRSQHPGGQSRPWKG